MKSTMFLGVIAWVSFTWGCEDTSRPSDADSVILSAGDDTVGTDPGTMEHGGETSFEEENLDGETTADEIQTSLVTELGWHLGQLPGNQMMPDCQLEVTGPVARSELARKADGIDRVFTAVNSRGHGLNADVRLKDIAAVDAITRFVRDESAQTLQAVNINPDDVVTSYEKAAGLYGGVGVAADAFRYAVLRDAGGLCSDIEAARSQLRKGLHALHVATAITGTPGVIARALALKGLPGAGTQSTMPLFDDDGRPLPIEKNNGTWREDNSGEYPDYIWEDSCSRDMYVGWVMAYASVWETILTDPTFEHDEKLRLQADAHALLESLMRVGDEGYDLEIRDADGRRTYHGILNENSVDRTYVANAPNGFNAMMAVGIVSALAWITGEPEHLRYAQSELIDNRGLLDKANRFLRLLDFGPMTNFSGYNMLFSALWLGARYGLRATDRDSVLDVTADAYGGQDRERQPIEQDQALYDLVYLMAIDGHSVHGIPDPTHRPPGLLEKIERILAEFPEPPVLAIAVENCDADEIESLDCTADDGTSLPLLGYVGWNEDLVAATPVPMRLRPRSNYYWRSNPYGVNGGGDGLGLLPAVDFRFVYWMGRRMDLFEE